MLMQPEKVLERTKNRNKDISLKAKTASYKKDPTEAARNRWKRKTENRNVDKDESKV